MEDRIKELMACGAARLPSTSYARNSAWLQLAAQAVTLLAWVRLLALDGDLALAEPKTCGSGSWPHPPGTFAMPDGES